MRLLRLMEPQPNRLAAAFLIAFPDSPIVKDGWPPDVPSDAAPYCDPNGLWFWAVKSKEEPLQ